MCRCEWDPQWPASTFFSRKIFERSSCVSPQAAAVHSVAGESSALGNNHIFSRQRSLRGPKVRPHCINKQTTNFGQNGNVGVTRTPKDDCFKGSGGSAVMIEAAESCDES